MIWQIVWTDTAGKDLRRLDARAAARVVAAVERLAGTGNGDVKRLHTDTPEWRLRVGTWRVRFVFEPALRVMRIRRVLPRGSAYR